MFSLLRKRVSLLFTFFALTLSSFIFADAPDQNKRIEIVSNGDAKHLSDSLSEYMDSSMFQSVVKAAIRELEGSLAGTCAKEMVVVLKIDAKAGGWKIVEVGMGGTATVRIMNPQFPAHCAH